MHLGSNQAITYGVETTHGYEVSPSANLGIVTGGNLNESSGIYNQIGVSSKITSRHLYTQYSCGGSCNLLLQDLTLINSSKLNARAGITPSFTIDCGVFNPINRRRMVGSKISSMKLSFKVNKPVYLDLEWVSIYSKEADQDWTPPSSYTYPIWVPSQIEYGAVGDHFSLTGLTSIDVSVNNNLIPRYMANRENLKPRSCSWIDNSEQTLEATFNGFDYIAPECRYLTPLNDNLMVLISLIDLCSNDTATILLSDCLQSETEEPLEPNEGVAYSNTLSVGGLSYTYTPDI